MGNINLEICPDDFHLPLVFYVADQPGSAEMIKMAAVWPVRSNLGGFDLVLVFNWPIV